MALDKLVDSTQLDTDLTSVANAIRTKGGTSAQLAFPADFVTAIGAISGSDLTFAIENIREIKFCKGSETNIYVDFTKLTGLATMANSFNGTSAQTAWSKIKIKPPATAMQTGQIFYAGSVDTAVKEIEIDGTLLLQTSSGNIGYFSNRKGLKTISGLLDLTRVTKADGYSNTSATTNMFASCIALETVSFVPGSMALTTTSWNLNWCAALTDDSLVSIANALRDTYSGTLTFHATPKARLSTIMGTVTTSDGLSIFTKSASGTVSLEDFLTITKGATLA